MATLVNSTSLNSIECNKITQQHTSKQEHYLLNWINLYQPFITRLEQLADITQLQGLLESLFQFKAAPTDNLAALLNTTPFVIKQDLPMMTAYEKADINEIILVLDFIQTQHQLYMIQALQNQIHLSFASHVCLLFC
jgi:hypothetical protein